ncbi:MAG: B12-binding domain-containing radical SAM protein [Candidatus Hodarchaeota archaeon]
MKVALVVPPLNFRNSEGELHDEYTLDGSLPPLGLMYIGALLKEKNYEVELLDLSATIKSISWFKDWLRKNSPDVIGFSIIADGVNNGMLLAEATKEVLPESLVIAGGISATFVYSEILKTCKAFDLVVRGEGEETMLKILEALESKGFRQRLQQIPGISYRHKGKIRSNPDALPIKDLDSLPFPDRSLSRIQYSYQFGPTQIGSKKFTTILTSRGCPYNCTFCACSAFTKRSYRERSPEDVLNEFEEIYSQGYRQALIADDHFFMKPRRTLKILRGLRRRKIDMDLVCESRVDYAKNDVLREATAAGVRSIFYGIESGSQRILDYYQKGTTVDQSRIAVEKARRAKMDMIVGSFMYGAPIETEYEMKQTSNLVLSLDIDVAVLNAVDILPGTKLWNDAKNDNLLPKDAWRRTLQASSIYPDAVPLHRVMEIINAGYKMFMKRLSWAFNQFVRTVRSRWRIGLIYNNLRINGIRKSMNIASELASSDRMYRYIRVNE